MKNQSPAGNLNPGFHQKATPSSHPVNRLSALLPHHALEQGALLAKKSMGKDPEEHTRKPHAYPLIFQPEQTVKACLLRTFLPVITAIVSAIGVVAYMVHKHTSTDPAILTFSSIVLTVALITASIAHLGNRLDKVIDRTKQKWVTIEGNLKESKHQLEERSIRLEKTVKELDELRQQLVSLTDNEKQRLGQELHDSLGQLLTAISFLSYGLEKQLPQEHHLERESARQIQEISAQAIQQTRNVAKGLFPSHIESHGLVGGINELCRQTRQTSQEAINCRFSKAGTIPPLPLETKLHLYRIAQEAITNALKHGKAREIEVQLRGGSSFVELAVTNDGDTPELHDKEQGIGLTIMRSRAEAIGGYLFVRMKKGAGCEVRCRLPIRRGT